MYITLENAISKIINEEIVALPTETVYGLAARFDSEVAIRKVFSAKNRPLDQPLILHVSSVSMAKQYLKNWSEVHDVLSSEFWPGPLTLLDEKSKLVSNIITAGSSKVAVRMPNHSIFLSIINGVQVPLVAPSANPHKRTSPTTAAHVEQLFNGQVQVVEGGPAQVGLESTILEILRLVPLTLKIARPGNITREQIDNVIKSKLYINATWSEQKSVTAPGQLLEHYRPEYPLVCTNELDHHSIVSFQKSNDCKIITLGGDAKKISQELYATLHDCKLADPSKSVIIYLPDLCISDETWISVIDRLTRASKFVVFL
jgi:L-threonylcarbamoyladenylate synthase